MFWSGSNKGWPHTNHASVKQCQLLRKAPWPAPHNRPGTPGSELQPRSWHISSCKMPPCHVFTLRDLSPQQLPSVSPGVEGVSWSYLYLLPVGCPVISYHAIWLLMTTYKCHKSNNCSNRSIHWWIFNISSPYLVFQKNKNSSTFYSIDKCMLISILQTK